MLAAACPAKSGQSVLDAGCGVGGASFCLLWRVPDLNLTGIDWEETYRELARRNLLLNEFSGNAQFIHADIRTYDPDATFDHVIMNPPYFEAGRHTPSPDAIRAQANGHQDDDLSLEDWIRAAHRLVRSNGSLTIIYPAHGTDKIILAMGKKFGAIEIIPLWPKQGVEAKRVIIRAIKDRQTPARILPGIVLHGPDGEYTDAADLILRDGHFI
jgi:tRNA1(Val) A37 N6-methylase TrmN6